MTPYTLNLLDLTLTLYAVRHGGVELNPLMQSIPVVVAWKVLGVGVLCLSLEKIASDKREKASDMARWGLRACAAVYAAVCIHHLIFIFGGI